MEDRYLFPCTKSSYPIILIVHLTELISIFTPSSSLNDGCSTHDSVASLTTKRYATGGPARWDEAACFPSGAQLRYDVIAPWDELQWRLEVNHLLEYGITMKSELQKKNIYCE